MNKSRQLHLAIFTPPFLELILTGDKIVEGRFARVCCAPHGRVNAGDRVLMKASGGPVCGEFIVDCVKSWRDPHGVNLKPIADTYALALCANADPYFWQTRQGSCYVTLMHMRDVKRYDRPQSFAKKDRRGWVVLGLDN